MIHACSPCAWASKLVVHVLYTSCVNFYVLVLLCNVYCLKKLNTHKYAMYIIQFKSCQSFYRIVKTLAVYVIMNDKRISSLWPRVYHSSFSDILVLHSDFTLTLQLWYRTLTCIQFTTSVFTMATTRLCFCLVPTHIPRVCLVPTHSSCFVI